MVVIGKGIADLLERDGMQELAYMGRKYPTLFDVEIDDTLGMDTVDVTTWNKWQESRRVRAANG